MKLSCHDLKHDLFSVEYWP